MDDDTTRYCVGDTGEELNRAEAAVLLVHHLKIAMRLWEIAEPSDGNEPVQLDISGCFEDQGCGQGVAAQIFCEALNKCYAIEEG